MPIVNWLYEGSSTASGAIITAIGTNVSAANLMIIPSANGLQVAIYEVNP